MADYKVGNLQIVFDTLNQTDEGFKKLASNLRAVQKAIAKIGDTDLNPFVANIKQITASFSPLLADINGASSALKDFNELTNRLGIKNVSNVAQAFNKLYEATEEAKEANGELSGVVKEDNNVLQETKNVVKDIWSTFSNDTIQSTLDLQKQEQQILRNKIAFLELKLEENDTEFSSLELRAELNRLKKELGDTEKGTKKGANGFKKFIKSIGRIALYRAIRGALKAITSSITETAKAFAQVDDGVNDTMSQLTSSLNIIKLSFGATLLPILQMITPIVQEIGIAFANVANMVSQAMSTTGTYTKINTDYIKNYRDELEKTGSLLDFDKFRALSGGKGGLSDFLIPNQKVSDSLEKVDLKFIGIQSALSGVRDLLRSVFDLIGKIGSSTAFQTFLNVIGLIVGGLSKAVDWLIKILDKSGLLEPILWGIFTVLGYIAATKIITWLSKGSIIKWLGAVIDLLKTDFRGTLNMLKGDLLKLLSTNQALAFSVGALVGAIAYFISNLKDMNTTAKVVIPVVAALAAAFTGLAVAKAAAAAGIAAPYKAAITAAALAAAITLAAGTAIAVGVGKYADGGVPNKGTLFFAGEAGAETVTVGSSGRTEVTNVQQMEDALYNALVRYSRTSSSGGSQPIVVNINGRPVFEAVRREANKSGLDFKRV